MYTSTLWLAKTLYKPTTDSLLAPLSRSPTPPLARIRGRGRNIFLSCSVHSAASNHPTISSPPTNFAPQSHCPVQKWLKPSSEGHLGEKIDDFIFFHLCRSSAAGDGGAAAGGGGAAAHGRGGAPGGSTRAISHNRRGMLNQSTEASTRGRP